ncbi:MAG: two-component regulator propeller domain-containing protein [Thermoanaerobaculia bacterium]
MNGDAPPGGDRAHAARVAPRQVPRLAAGWLAVAIAVAVSLDAERLPLRLFNSSNGLAGDLVIVVRQDSRGILWFGTDGGVSRFDGTSFRNYGRSEGVPEGWVADVLETRSGELLFATGGGVCRLLDPATLATAAVASRRELFACEVPGESPEATEVRALHEDRLGRLWAATAAGLYRVERRATPWKFEHVALGSAADPWAATGVREIVEEPGGGLWLATAVGIAHRAEDGRVARFRVGESGVDQRIFALLLDSGGRLWIGHVDEGVYVWKPTAGLEAPAGGSIASAAARPRAGARPGAIRLPESAGEAIRIRRGDGLDDERARTGLLEDRDGTIWIGTVRGLGRFRDGRLERFGRENGLPDDGVRPSLVDRSGNLWFGSPSGGAVRLRRSGFTTYDAGDGLRGFRIRSIGEGRDGVLYVLSSAERDFVQRFDGERFAAVAPTLPAGLAYTGWWNGQVGFEDREGEWWLPTGVDGLLRYPRSRRLADLERSPLRAHYRVADGLASAAVQVLFEDRRGDIWIGAFAAPYLSVWRRASARFESFGERAGVPRDAPTVFREDAAGRLWIGFGDGTIGTFDGGRLAALDRGRLPRWNAVYDLLFDRAGRLWVASIGGGLARLDAPSAEGLATPARSYTLADGLSSNDVHCLAEDLHGRIYACTDQGIDRLDPATGRVRRLTTADGLANNVVRAAFRDRHGDLWFGTMQGLSRLRSEPEPASPAPPALLTAVEIAGVPEPLGETGTARLGPLRLAAGADRLRIGFVAPSADLDREPTYRYRLEGLESAWSAPTRDRAVTYAGLRPGDYRFAVVAVLPEGTQGEPATFEFTLPPPLWRRWWALAVLAALPLAGAYFFHRQRLARLVAVERVRTRIAADLHDDLGASLSRIAVLSEVANRRAENAGGATPELLEIADTARQITDEASDMVWSIDPRRDDLASLLTRLRRLAADLLGERGIALEWIAPADAGSIRLAADQRRHLLLILKEAIHNAARHAGASRVEVRVEASRHELQALVRDDGRGFDVGRPRTDRDGGGRGLLNLEQRARELGGRLAVRSAPGAGTAVSLAIPRRARAASAPHEHAVSAPPPRR